MMLEALIDAACKALRKQMDEEYPGRPVRLSGPHVADHGHQLAMLIKTVDDKPVARRSAAWGTHQIMRHTGMTFDQALRLAKRLREEREANDGMSSAAASD